MEIYQLRTFVTVAQQGHLTQASELLHLSQPAVTAQIKALEEELGVSLFERTTSGVVLTKAGMLLIPEAEKTLAAAREMLNKAKGLKDKLVGKIRLGTISDAETLRLGDFMTGMLSQYPLLEIYTRQGISGTILNDVRKKELDAGYFIGKNPYVNVHSIHLADLSFVVVAPPVWAERVLNAGWKELGKMPWVWTSQFSSYNKLATEMFRENNISPPRIFEVDQENTIKNLVKAGVGLSVMRAEYAREYADRGEVVIWPGTIRHAPLLFVYPGDRDGDPILEAMKTIIHQIWDGAGAAA